MIRILFVCHGNICRSPMAEYIFRDYVEKQGVGDRFHIESAATSTEELGNPVHPGTRKVLHSLGIDASGHRARQLRSSDYIKFDYFIGMDSRNIRNMIRIFKHDPQRKIYKFLSFSERPRDIADPWYTGQFDETFIDVCDGCETFYRYLQEQNMI